METLVQAVSNAARANVVLLVEGGVGIGKTAGVEHLFKRTLNFDVVETIILSLRQPEDLLGPLLYDPQSNTSRNVAPDWVVRLSKAERGALIFDEITTCSKQMLHAMLRIINERYVGNIYLDPARITIVALCNPAEMAQGNDLSVAMGTRFQRFVYEPVVAEWCASFPDYWGQNPEIKTPLGNIPANVYQQARELVAKFVGITGKLYCPPEDTSVYTDPFATARTWDAVSRLIAAAIHNGEDIHTTYTAARGLIGDAVAGEFYTWYANRDLQDPLDVLTNPDSIRTNVRSDQLISTLGGVLTIVQGDPTVANWLNAWRVLGNIARAGSAGFAVNTALELAALRTSNLPDPAAADIQPYLDAINVRGKIRE